MDLRKLFERTAVYHPVNEFEDRKPLVCAVSIKRRVQRDIRTATEKLYKECKNAPHPKVIHTKIIGSRRLAEPKAFFGTDMVTWLVDNGWSNSRESAQFLCSEILFSNKIIVPVYPFIKKFVSEQVLYKFARDNKERKEATPRRENAFKIAKDICFRRLQEQSRKSGSGRVRHGSNDSDPLGLPSSSSITSRFRRSSSGSSTPSDSGSVFIAGNMLLSMIDKGCDGQLTSQLMLRYGFISPVISDSITSRDLSTKQVFYAQEKYKFSDEVVRSVSRLATISSSSTGTRRPSVVISAVNRRLSQELSLGQQGLYKTLSGTKEYALEKPMTLDRANFFTRTTPTVHESSVFDIKPKDRRLSLVEPKKYSLLEKFRKTSK